MSPTLELELEEASSRFCLYQSVFGWEKGIPAHCVTQSIPNVKEART